MDKRRLTAILAAAALLVAALIWFGTRGTDGKAEAASAPPPQVLAAAAITREHAPRSTYTGSLTAVQTVELKPRVSGYIQAVNVPEGQFVRQGQQLFAIDSAPFRARLEAARAATREAQARLNLARAENTRASRLVAEGVVAQERADQASATLAERQAQLASARSAERLAALDLSYTTVEAPISGRVGKILVTRGNLVAGGEAATPLTTIVSVDPLYVEFNVDEPTYLAALAASRTAGPAARLNDPELDRLISRALANNLDARLAVARLEEARALARAARTKRLPSGGADASYQRRRLADVERFGTAPRDGNVFTVGADARWEADLFGRVRRSVEAAEAEVGGADALLQSARAAVTADVASRYFDLRGAQAALRVAEASIANQRRSLDVTRRLTAAGAGARLDIIRAEAELRAVEATVPDIRREAAVARHALAVLLGEQPQGFAGPVASPSANLHEVTYIAVGTPADLLRRRPDIRAAERALAAASARAGAARAELFPQIQLTGFIGLLAGSLGNLVSGGALSFGAGPAVSWGVFDLPRLRAQVGAADARTEAALVNYHSTVLGALREVEDALVTYGAVRDEMARLAARAEASREAARLTGIGFREGVGQYLDVLVAERSRVEAEAALVEAQAQHLLSVVGVYRALGGGWEVCDLPGGPDCPNELPERVVRR